MVIKLKTYGPATKTDIDNPIGYAWIKMGGDWTAFTCPYASPVMDGFIMFHGSQKDGLVFEKREFEAAVQRYEDSLG